MAGVTVLRDVPTIIVNRLGVDWISATADEATLFPDVPIRSPFAMNLTKDFTGSAPS